MSEHTIQSRHGVSGSRWLPSSEDRLLLLFQALRPEQAHTFLALVTQIVPHADQELSAARVATALSLDSQMVTNLSLRSTVLDGLHDLDGRSMTAHKRRFVDLADVDQSALLKAVETSPFFQAMVHQVKYDFYNRHIVWDVLGYPDLSNDAGYLDRGFDRLEG